MTERAAHGVPEGAAHPHAEVTEARAKVNVFLRVLGRRGDGYHELETLIVPVSLADRLEVHAANDPDQFATLSLSLEVTGDPRLTAGVPADASNLVLRAATALAEPARVRGFADIALEKRIPPAAGLGGGSSDAAATLLALNRLWALGLGLHELSPIAATVGSDVPALLSRTGALAQGRGDRIEPVSTPPLRWCLVTFPFGVRTSDAFAWWDEDSGRTGPDPGPALRAARAGDAQTLGLLLFNDLESPVMRRHPEVRTAKERLLESGAVGAVMCGSGPTVAGLLVPGGECSLPEALAVTSGGG
jgi:4-diphosphocytidyl-2-C-methyl-D-erythritol kinase